MRGCVQCDTIVIDSRLPKDGIIRRRRKCLKCGKRYSTKEATQDQYKEYLELKAWKNSVSRFINARKTKTNP